MFRYIVNSTDNEEKSFLKFNYLDEVKHYIEQTDPSCKTDESGAMNSDVYNYQYGTNDRMGSDVHVYRIKDISDAISTSVIMEGSQKADYLQMLNNDDSDKINANVDFVNICKNVGECDIY